MAAPQKVDQALLETEGIDTFAQNLFQQFVATTKRVIHSSFSKFLSSIYCCSLGLFSFDSHAQANELPSGDEYQFQTTFSNFRTQCDSLSQRILNLTQVLPLQLACHNVLQRCIDAKQPNYVSFPETSDVSEALDSYDRIVDVVDSLIEEVVSCALFLATAAVVCALVVW